VTPERIDTVVIGGGQAGLSASYFLSQRGREHLVLEQGRVGESWRSQRWDGFYLNTPNWSLQLPGHHYAGGEPDAFAPLPEVIDYLERYAAFSEAPLRTGVGVNRLQRQDERYLLDTSTGPVEARNVVVATGAFQRPTPPPVSGDVPALHTSDYRNPAQLPPGAVLVVGSGQSGCQIAEELLAHGRRVYLSAGRCPWFPRRYLGRDVVHWLLELGLADQTVDTLPAPSARLACNPALSGAGGIGQDCNPRTLERDGAVLVGRIERIDAGTARIAPGLDESLAKGDEFEAAFKQRCCEHAGLEPEPEAPPAPRREEIRELDLGAAGVGTVLWANGYRPDFGWIDLPVVDELGWPLQARGVSEFPGLYFLGINWLHKRKSALLFGVGEDAEYVVSHLAGRAGSVG
jgi:putative flavoprotein involved in K+ transport